MNGTFFVGATGLRAQEKALSVVANNIANLNTAGFKRSGVQFSELVGAVGGVASSAPSPNFAQGDIRATGQQMDIAVDGAGFIEVLGADGTALLWRGGRLSIDADGLLATGDGLPLHAMIRVPDDASELTVTPDGRVTAVLAGETAPVELGRIDLQRPADLAELEVKGAGLYRASGEARAAFVPGEQGVGLLVQGAVEGANVSLSNEMVSMMLMQRSFAASAQVLQAGDQLMAIANGLRR